MLFDAHAHFFSRRFYQFHADLAGVKLDEVQRVAGAVLPSDDPVALADRWITELNANQVDRVVLIASIPGDEAGVHAAVQRDPSRITGYFMLDPTVEDAVKRARRALDQGLAGVCLFPALHRFDPGDERCLPLYRELERRRAICFVHFGALKIPLREKLKLPPVADLRYSNPVLLHRAANACPGLTFVIPHFGGGMFRETLLLGAQAPNVCVDTSSSNSWMALYPGLDLKRVFEMTLHAFGPRRILFGTDSSAFPRGWRADVYRDQLNVINALCLTPAERAGIWGENLAQVLAGRT